MTSILADAARLDKLHKRDPSFPRPIKGSDIRQAAAYYVVAEVEAWLQRKIAERDADLQKTDTP